MLDPATMAGLANAGLTILGGLGDSRTARQQSEIIENAIPEAVSTADPFSQERSKYVGLMGSLYSGDTSALSIDPGYQFRFDQGLQALNRNAASKGFLNSGRMGIELLNYGQGLASQEYQSAFDRLARLSGLDSANLGTASEAISGGATAMADLKGKEGGGLGGILGGLSGAIGSFF